MKWFKHMSDTSNQEFISLLEGKFGLEGYARWFKLLEIIAKQMDGTNKCYCNLPVAKWQQLLSFRYIKNLKEFLLFCVSHNELEVSSSSARAFFETSKTHRENSSTSGELKIICVKLLELRDEHTRKLASNSGVTQEQLAQELELDKEKKKENTKEKEMFLLDFKISSELDLNDQINCVGVMEELVGRRLSKKEQEEVAKWIGEYDIRNFVMPILLKMLDKYKAEHKNETPYSICFFSSALEREAINTNPIKQFANGLSKKMRMP